MADFQLCLSQGLLEYLCQQSREAVAKVDMESAQHFIFRQYPCFSILVSVPLDCESLSNVQALDAKDQAFWHEVQSILNFYARGPKESVKLPSCGTYSIASFIKACAADFLRSQMVFEIGALAEKDQGNACFKSYLWEEALARYTKALALLGISVKKLSKGPDFTLSTEAQRSLELSMAVLSNRSLCFLKLGHTLNAIEDAQRAIDRMEFSGRRPVNIQAYTKAKHRLASALVRAARFKEAVDHLDAIDTMTGNRTTSMELRSVIKTLRQSLAKGCVSFFLRCAICWCFVSSQAQWLRDRQGPKGRIFSAGDLFISNPFTWIVVKCKLMLHQVFEVCWPEQTSGIVP